MTSATGHLTASAQRVVTGGMVLEKLGVAARHHPAREECARRAAEWMSRRDYFDGLTSASKVASWNFADLGSAMYPDAELTYPVLTASWTNWIAVVDDMVECDPQRIDALRSALLGARTKIDPSLKGLVDGWTDISATLTHGAPEAFALRVEDALAQLFDAYSWEVPYRSEDKVPPSKEYLRMRPATAGMPTYFLILERTVDGPIEEGALSAPWFHQLNQLVGNLACWANDLLTFRWDQDIGNPINLVRVLTRDPEHPAYDRALQHFQDVWLDMEKVRQEAIRVAPPKARAYVQRIPEVASGVLVWMDLTRRYSEAPTC